MDAYPTKLNQTTDRILEIGWNDDVSQRIPIDDLRKVCPCATCREKRNAEANKPKSLLPVLTKSEAAPIQIARMQPVGNYAYNIHFSDGHHSGIFTFEFLRGMMQSDSNSPAKK